MSYLLWVEKELNHEICSFQDYHRNSFMTGLEHQAEFLWPQSAFLQTLGL